MKTLGRLARAALFLLVICSARHATAAYAGFVCNVALIPMGGVSSSLGDHGYGFFTVYSGPDCSGSYVGSFYLCTENSTSTNCATGTAYDYTATSLNMIVQALIDSSGWNYHVDVSGELCKGGGGGYYCAGAIWWIAN